MNSGHLLLAAGFRIVVRGLYSVVLARFLGPELFGLFNYGLNWYLALLPLSVLGLETVLSVQVGRKHRGGRAVIGETLVLRVIMASLVSAASAWAAYFEPALEVRAMLVLMSVALFARSLALWANSVFVASESSRWVSRVDVLFRSLEVALGSALLFSGAGLLAIAILHAAVWCAQAIVATWIVRARIAGSQLRLCSWPRRALLAASLPLALVTVAESWLLLGPLLLSRILAVDKVDLGQIALVFQVLVLAYSLPRTVARASLPVLSRSISRQDGKAKHFVQVMTVLVLACGVVGGALAMMFAVPVVSAVFGHEYSSAGALLRSAVFTLIPASIALTLNYYLFASDRLWRPACCTAIGAVTMTVVFPSLLDSLGVAGVVLAFAVGVWSWLTIIVLLFASRLVIGSFAPRHASQTNTHEADHSDPVL